MLMKENATTVTFAHILKQPASCKVRFLGFCMEGARNRTIKGQYSTPAEKTFPKIQIFGYNGPAVVVVSCVTHDNFL